MFLILIPVFMILGANAQVEFGCSSEPLPEFMDECPDTTTKVKAGGCCPDDDTYIITTTTTTTTTTTVTPPIDTCVDLVNPKTQVSDCPNAKAYCTNSIYHDLMKEQCPKTCGYCNSGPGPAPSACVDLLNPKTQVSDCPNMKGYCFNAFYADLMKQQCPKTCGYCTDNGSVTTTLAPAPAPVPSTTCVDLLNPTSGISDCPRMANYCTNGAYLDLMKEQCPKTCGYCR